MTDLIQTHLKCPLCLSRNVMPVSRKALIITGVGGIIGGIIAVVATKNNSDGIQAGPVIAGTLTGAMAGMSIGKVIQKEIPGSMYLCLDCCRLFPNAGWPGKRRNRKNQKNRKDNRRHYCEQS